MNEIFLKLIHSNYKSLIKIVKIAFCLLTVEYSKILETPKECKPYLAQRHRNKQYLVTAHCLFHVARKITPMQVPSLVYVISSWQ